MELTNSELPVADLVARGFSEKEIANKLFLSVFTIRAHTYNIRKRNNLRSCVDIAREYILSLENPKQYFAAIMFLIMQLSISVNHPNTDLRRAPIERSKVRTMTLTSRRIQFS